METIKNINACINNIVWGPFMLLFLVGTGIFFSVKLRFFQLTGFKTWWKKTALSFMDSKNNKDKKSGISPFRAMATALAGSIGTGNIVGVANAIALGGAGAVFWMWIAAFFGMATVFAENVLGVKYRVKRNGKYVGGPMYYIEKGLGCKPLAVIFAFFCTLAAFGMGNITQSNSVAGALKNGFGINNEICGIVLSIITALIIFGGIERISSLTEKLVPIMAVIYTLAVIAVLAVNFADIPPVLARIVSEAFDIKAAAGGITGYGISKALKYGISRGVFSNEAGLGSSPIVHSAAETDNPYEQGMWGIFQVFIDTIVLCTLMALCILTTGSDKSGLDGIELGALSFSTVLGNAGNIFLSLSIVLFAFATLVSWSYYGEKSFEYLTKGKYIKLYRIIYSCAVYLGCITSISLVWEISDTLNGLMAIPNLIALILLSSEVRYSEINNKSLYNKLIISNLTDKRYTKSNF